MGNIATINRELPKDAATGLVLPLTKSLSPQKLESHRARIGFELEVIALEYDRFGWNRDRNSPVQTRLIINWMDALQDFPLPEVQAACRAHVEANPKQMPNWGHIKALIVKARQSDAAKHRATLPKQDVARELSPVEVRRANAASLGLRAMQKMPIDGGDA